MNKYIKKRNWAFVLWPDSAPIEWRDILQETGLMFAISPFHDKDLNPDGSPKKPHYHVIMCFDGPTTFNNACSIAKRVGANTVQPLEQIRGYYRYFTHIDNPEKYQYNDKDITTINGFNINNYIELTYSEINNLLFQIQYIIKDKKITEYSELCDLLHESDSKELWEIAISHTTFLDRYITSRRYKTKKEKTESEDFSDVVFDIL